MGMVASKEVVIDLLSAYRDLVPAEAKLANAIAARGIRVRSTVADQWSTLTDYVNLYGSGLSPAGVLVLGAGPDEGSKHTGIPFTGPRFARETLGLGARGDSQSPSEQGFWGAVQRASQLKGDAPLESFFGTVHLTHARPFNVESTHEVKDASARHITRILTHTRPQLIIPVGTEPLHLLARATGDTRLLDVASVGEESWLAHWGVGMRLLDYPYVDVPLRARPFRARLAPVPALDGAHAAQAAQALTSLFTRVWSS
ncbi:MAG: hypothetical protein WDA16_03670 [Candidatus Thermoplasmatota archaeon]